MKSKTLGILGIVIVLAFSIAYLGCGGTDNANAADNTDADPVQQASNSKEDSEDSGKESAAEGEDGEDEDEEEAVPVEIAELAHGPIESVLRFSSNLEAESQVEVFSQAKRLVTALQVEEGDRVRKGQVLLRLQDDEQRSALAKASSQLAKAEREYKQQERLFDQELISEQAFNDATYELEQLQISLEDAERELSYTAVTAPISGTITNRMVNLGDQVQIGQHLFDLVDFNSIVARVYVPEKYLHQLRTGLSARLSSQSSDAAAHVARVKRISPIVDPKSGTVKVTIDVGSQAGLRPGMYVDVDLVVATHAEAVLVPKRAVIYDNDQMFVYKLAAEAEGQRVERVFIEPALTDKFFIEPREGLNVGDQVVVAGQAGLKDGALVSLPGTGEDDEDAASGGEQSDEVEVTERARL